MTLQYGLVFISALILSLLITPISRMIAIRLNFFDHPSSPIKTHREPIPYLGGLAIMLSFLITLTVLRLTTDFPTGTLHTLRGLFAGGIIIFLIGLADDLGPSKAYFIGYKLKFVFQIIAAIILIVFDIRLKFVNPVWFSWIITIIWIVAITNAFNLIDIMDGLSSSQAIAASLAFLFISLPTEKIYVNFAAAACAGACLGFLPYNLSKRWKIFMGDTGSLSIGFLMAALSLGTSYTQISDVGLFAPLLILGLPLYDTVLVSILRILKGQSPFLGSKDHLALKLAHLGLSKKAVVSLCFLMSMLLSLCAILVSWLSLSYAITIYGIVLFIGIFGVIKLRKVHVI